MVVEENIRDTFQSLSGFLMRCDRIRTITAAGVGMFQSLSGFLMRCDCTLRDYHAPERPVSIPIGFSDAL